MRGKTHLIAGAGVGLSVLLLTIEEPITAVASGALALLGSIVPDIDNKKSMVGSKMKITSTITNKIFGHRGITHTPALLIVFFAIIFGCLLGTGNMQFLPLLVGFTMGCASHLLLDMFTKGGIPLLFPLSKKRVKLTPFKTGGIFEILFGIAIAILNIVIAITILIFKFSS
jgi:inner membrane protein